MSSEEDLKIKNADSLSPQRATRRKRSKLKDLRKQEKESLQGASSTSRRREVKGYYEEQRGKIMDVSVNPPQSENQDGANNDTSQAGIDSSVEHGSGGGGGGGGTFELDVVKDDNTAGRASFTGGGII